MNYSTMSLALFAVMLMVLFNQARAVPVAPLKGLDIKMDPETTVEQLKGFVSSKLGVEANDVKLTLDGDELDESKKLADYSMTNESNIDYKLTNDGDRKQETSATTKYPTYFGVDASDEEAVKRRQRELSEEKFRELFGDEAHFQMNLDHEHDHDQDQDHDLWRMKNLSIKDALKWLVNSIWRLRGQKSPEAQSDH